MQEVTRILCVIERGDPQAAGQPLPLVYEELRRLAAEKMAQEKPGQTLQATALVHEAYIRLVEAERAHHWESWGIFSPRRPRPCAGFLSRMPGAKLRLKRGRGRCRVSLEKIDLAAFRTP